jgi:hypothetical protein
MKVNGCPNGGGGCDAPSPAKWGYVGSNAGAAPLSSSSRTSPTARGPVRYTSVWCRKRNSKATFEGGSSYFKLQTLKASTVDPTRVTRYDPISVWEIDVGDRFGRLDINETSIWTSI